MPYVLRWKYGMRAHGRVFGLSFMTLSLGTVIGPGAIGLVYDRIGSYTPMLLIFAAAGMAAAVIVSVLAPKR